MFESKCVWADVEGGARWFASRVTRTGGKRDAAVGAAGVSSAWAARDSTRTEGVGAADAPWFPTRLPSARLRCESRRRIETLTTTSDGELGWPKEQGAAEPTVGSD